LYKVQGINEHRGLFVLLLKHIRVNTSVM